MMIADTHRLFWRANAILAFTLEGVFYNSIFQGMKRNDRQSSAPGQVGDGLRQCAAEVAEFPIQGDPDRLEGAGGGVDAVVMLTCRFSDQICQLSGGFQGTGLDDGPGDAPGKTLFAKLPDQL